MDVFLGENLFFLYKLYQYGFGKCQAHYHQAGPAWWKLSCGLRRSWYESGGLADCQRAGRKLRQRPAKLSVASKFIFIKESNDDLHSANPRYIDSFGIHFVYSIKQTQLIKGKETSQPESQFHKGCFNWIATLWSAFYRISHKFNSFIDANLRPLNSRSSGDWYPCLITKLIVKNTRIVQDFSTVLSHRILWFWALKSLRKILDAAHHQKAGKP